MKVTINGRLETVPETIQTVADMKAWLCFQLGRV